METFGARGVQMKGDGNADITSEYHLARKTSTSHQ